jgi:hypothetical protein
MNDPTQGLGQVISANATNMQSQHYYDSSNANINTLADFSNYNYHNGLELENVKKEILTMKLQTLKITGKMEDQQYKNILGMLASTDEKDLEMARLSIRTLWDEQL